MEPQRSAVSSKAMIAGTSEPLAVHAGLEVLKHGGNAADAALTTSLAQIALTAGAAVSYGGIMTAVYYDAASGKAYTLDAGYNTVKNEKVASQRSSYSYKGEWARRLIDAVQREGGKTR